MGLNKMPVYQSITALDLVFYKSLLTKIAKKYAKYLFTPPTSNPINISLYSARLAYEPIVEAIVSDLSLKQRN